MRKNKISLALVFAFVLSVGAQIGLIDQGQCAETRIINIYGGAGPNASPRIEPSANMWVTPETVVVFTNWSQSEVRISFDDGTRCDEATAAAAGFKVEEACYVTDMWIPYGGTASLKFDKVGKYSYKVIYKNTKEEERGRLNVQPAE